MEQCLKINSDEKINDFFWFCSGAHTETLKKYPTELNKYVGVGASIFFTA